MQPDATMPRFALLLAMISLGMAGCWLPQTTVHKDPGPHDCGVRYYRPKPYLMVKPLANDDGEPVTGHVTIEQVVLPDYSEEYSIHVRSGLGVNNTSITLNDGWNLTALNIETDSKFAESLEATAELVDAIPSLTASKDTPATNMVVRAINVPMGLYEAVLSPGADGRKRLYGFRYVGFLPYATCPVSACGEDHQPCNCGEYYGLVFEEGVMVFRPLTGLSDHVALTRLDASESRNLKETANSSHTSDREQGSLLDDIESAPPLDVTLPSPMRPSPMTTEQ
ncbi:MAG: hypothetical protein KDA60_10290 [Planctomycetales bacterium]|nr:hypothetical protein [Planctomycetales bacterium]